LHLKAINMGMAVDTERGLLVRSSGMPIRKACASSAWSSASSWSAPASANPSQMTFREHFHHHQPGGVRHRCFHTSHQLPRSSHPGRWAHRAPSNCRRWAACRAHHVHPFPGLRPPPGGWRSGCPFPGVPEGDHRRALPVAQRSARIKNGLHKRARSRKLAERAYFPEYVIK